MSRETVAAKAPRYLAEGRLVITSVMGDYVAATCRGNGEIYELGHDIRHGWWCSCAAPAGRCCHLTALRLVTVRRRPAAAEVHQDTRQHIPGESHCTRRR
jgi:hypothetical protein